MVVLKLVDLNEKIVDSWFLKYTPANDMSLNPDPVLELVYSTGSGKVLHYRSESSIIVQYGEQIKVKLKFESSLFRNVIPDGQSHPDQSSVSIPCSPLPSFQKFLLFLSDYFFRNF